MHSPLTKSAVARSQLATAIELFFAGRDSVSIYSLAANAWEVTDALCTRAGVESMSIQARGCLPVGKDLKRNYVNSPHRNFFKHADNDPHETVEPLSESQVEGLLFLAVEDYIRLNRRSPVQLQVFQLWYLAKYPEKLDPTVAVEVFEGVAQAFPGLASLPPRDQLAWGSQMLAQASVDQLVLADPRTERAFE
jgi:hypothetical protein